MQIELEGQSESLDYDLLPGKWRLVYTSAPDVAPLVASNSFNSLLPVRVGDIYQEFSSVALGQVKNIITFKFPGLLESGESEAFLLCVASAEGSRLEGQRTVRLALCRSSSRSLVLQGAVLHCNAQLSEECR